MFDLTQERLRELLDYDPATGDFHWRIKTGNRRAGTLARTTDADGYQIISIQGKKLRAHRLAYLYMNGQFPDRGMDHINANKLDNSWSNLRLASAQGNQANKPLMRNNTTGHKGVFRCSKFKRTGRWRAQIVVNGVARHIGQYATKEAAAEAYARAAELHFGEFARVA